MKKKRIWLRISSILTTLCFVLNITAFLTIPNLAAANEPVDTYSASQLVQKAIEFVHGRFMDGEKIDGYTAYVLTRSGEDLGSGKWTYNGKTLKSEIEELVDLLGDHVTLINYICATQNADGSFGPYANEYGTRVPLLALASIKEDLQVGTDEHRQVEEAINKAINYFKEKYQDGTITYDTNSYSFDYRCIEALVKTGENLSVGDWVYQGTSLKDAVIASAEKTASDPSAKVVDLAKELTALYTVQSYSATAATPTLASAVRLEVADEVASDATNEVVSDATYEVESDVTNEVVFDATDVVEPDATNEAEPALFNVVKLDLANEDVPEIIVTLADAIKHKQKTDGSFGQSIYDHVTVLSALGKAERLGSIDQAKAFAYIDGLKKNHKNIFGWDAGVAWGSEWTPEEADTTSQVITALSYFDDAITPGSDVYQTVQDGLTYLMDVQDPDAAAIAMNGWDSTYATAETLIALKTLGRSYAGNESVWTKKSRTNTIAKCLMALGKWNDTNRQEHLANLLQERQKTTDPGQGSFEDSVYSDMWAYIALGEAGKIGSLNVNDAKTYLLSKQSTDGSWGETFDGTYYSDFLSTTQAIRALTYLPGATDDQQIQAAITNGLNYLKSLQQADGGLYSAWDDPTVDNSEVINTLNILGKDPTSAAWKNAQGLTPVDYLLNNTMNADGSFGTSKTVFGATEALAAYWLVTGQGTPGGGVITPIPTEDQCSVEIAVVGQSGELLFGPGSVEVSKNNQWGLTVMGALDATGLSYNEKGGLVNSIDGQSNSGLKGWMYKVNGSSPPMAASSKTVKEGDQIIWWYSSDVNSSGPAWDSLSKEAVPLEAVLPPNLQEQNKNLPAALQASEDALLALETINQTLGLQKNTLELGPLGQRNQTVVVVGDWKPINLTTFATKKDIAQNPVQISQKVEASKGAAVAEDGVEVGLIIPAEALTKDTEILINKLDSDNTSLPAGFRRISATYEFGPDGTQFKTPVTVALQAVIPPLVKPDNLALASYDKATGNWVAVPAVVDLNNGVIWGRIQHFSNYAVFAKEVIKSFTDVNAGSCGWAQGSIETLAGAGIIGGVDDKHFEPFRSVTRAEFTVMLVKALALPEKGDTAASFKDVKGDNWYAGALATAYESGVVKGYKDGYFCPNNTITREEVAAILSRAMELQSSDRQLPFADRDQVKPWARASVLAASERGLIKGFPDETFRPDLTTSRAECAVMIYRMLTNI